MFKNITEVHQLKLYSHVTTYTKLLQDVHKYTGVYQALLTDGSQSLVLIHLT
jgi:hypothetical protein